MSGTISMTSTNRIIALVDMDCFYVQVEERDDPSIKGIPAAVVQYKTYKGGGIIAVNYEARGRGVTRNMRGDDAKAVCPEIKLVRVPENRGKADLTKYRDAGAEVIKVLMDFSSCVERASIDEAYIDLTESVELRLAEIQSQDTSSSWGELVVQSLNMDYLATSFVLGYESTQKWLDSLKNGELPSLDDMKLAIGAEIVGKMRDAVYKRTNFRCSAGIAHNKVLAKLVCGINKPNKQTVLPHESIAELWSKTKVGKVRGLGGKLGDLVENLLGCVYMSDISKFTEKELCTTLGSKTGAWLYQLSLGYDDEDVTPRQLPKSIGCNKNFNGPEALKTKDKVKFWINQLATEVVERVLRDLEMNKRRAKTLTLHVKFENQNSLSRSCGVPHYNAERMAADAYSVMEKLYQSVGVLPINSLGLIASKFEDEVDTAGCFKIDEFFKAKSSTIVNPSDCSNSSSSVSNNNVENEQYKSENLENSCSVPSKSRSLNSDSVSENPDSLHIPVPGTSKTICGDSSEATSKRLGVQDKKESALVNGATVEDRGNKFATPKKFSVATDADVRKPFFQFVASAPKNLSPCKSPIKLMSSAYSHKALAVPHKEFTEANSSLLKECDRCGKKIMEWDFASHMDYHFAKDLSRELNGLPAKERNEKTKKPADANSTERLSLKRPRGRGGSSSGSKRGRGAKTSSSVPLTSNSRSIESYFGPKS